MMCSLCEATGFILLDFGEARVRIYCPRCNGAGTIDETVLDEEHGKDDVPIAKAIDVKTEGASNPVHSAIQYPVDGRETGGVGSNPAPSTLQRELASLDYILDQHAKAAGVERSQLTAWILNKAIPSASGVGTGKTLLDQIEAGAKEEERIHLELHDTRDAQEVFFEKYRLSDPENYRLFREAREKHHESLLKIRGQRMRQIASLRRELARGKDLLKKAGDEIAELRREIERCHCTILRLRDAAGQSACAKSPEKTLEEIYDPQGEINKLMPPSHAKRLQAVAEAVRREQERLIEELEDALRAMDADPESESALCKTAAVLAKLPACKEPEGGAL